MEKRLHLVYHGRFPSEKAAALFAAHSAAAFEEVGVHTTLVAPRRFGREKQTAQAYYHLPKPITTLFLPTLDLFFIPFFQFFAFRISYFAFSVAVFVYALLFVKKQDIVYTNEALPALFASLAGKRTVYELHDFPESSFFLYRAVFKRALCIVATNEWKKKELSTQFSVPEGKIFVEQNAVSVEEFDLSLSKEAAREKLKLSKNGSIALYTGHLYEWKGVHVLAEAAEKTPNVEFYFVGGTPKDVQSFKARYGATANVHILGHMPHNEIPLWQRAADVLVLPNSGTARLSSHYTSPMKLFEYMASQTPIVLTDLSSAREVVGEDSALFVSSDSSDALSKGITEVFIDQEKARARAKNARAHVGKHDWTMRAHRITQALFWDESQG
jgi:glycosyltransferase involved in cell wall biosynthesis